MKKIYIREEVQCQLLIFAIGVSPNIDLVKGTSIRANRGIVVNKYLETSIPDSYAAGDVAEAFDLVMGIDRAIPIWPSVYIQGTVAGYNMAGLPRKYEGWFAMNSVEICGLPTISVGLTVPPEDGYEILEDYHPQKLTYRKIVLKDDRVWLPKEYREHMVSGVGVEA